MNTGQILFKVLPSCFQKSSDFGSALLKNYVNVQVFNVQLINVYVLHTWMYIIKLLQLSPICIFYHLWPAVVAKKSLEFFSKAESLCCHCL